MKTIKNCKVLHDFLSIKDEDSFKLMKKVSFQKK